MAENRGLGLSFAVLVVLALVIVGIMQLVAGVIGGGTPPPLAHASVADRIRPVGQLNTDGPITVAAPTAQVTAAAPPVPAAAPAAPSAAPAKTAARSGEQVYTTVCQVCHGAGVAGAPKLDDKAAWAPRIKQGMDLLVQHATNGFTGKTGVMPPRGTCANCSDQEIRSAVEYMVSKAK